MKRLSFTKTTVVAFLLLLIYAWQKGEGREGSSPRLTTGRSLFSSDDKGLKREDHPSLLGSYRRALWHKLFTFEGRDSRWVFLLSSLVPLILWGFFFYCEWYALAEVDEEDEEPPYIAIFYAFFIPSGVWWDLEGTALLVVSGVFIFLMVWHTFALFTLSVRRLHDMGYSGWTAVGGFLSFFLCHYRVLTSLLSWYWGSPFKEVEVIPLLLMVVMVGFLFLAKGDVVRNGYEVKKSS